MDASESTARESRPYETNTQESLQYLAQLEELLGKAEEMFRAGFGTAPARRKSGGSPVTTVDFSIEEYLRDTLQGIAGATVCGEEHGGEIGAEPAWVIDPIDGTANFAAGNPMCAINVALVANYRPVVGMIALPLLHKRISAVAGGGVLRNGEHFVRHRPHGHIGASNVGSAAVDQISAHRRAQMLEDIVSQGLSTRITGSVGLDLAFAAEGIFDGIMNFSPFPWDNAAGALLNAEAGLVVTDLEGRPWTTRSHGIIAGSADIHHRLHRLVREN